jgi:eukaryotic-like serine/threonine-protein kinase
MPLSSQAPGVLRFGAFEVDLQEGELRKSGLRIKLQEQPFQVLVILLERPGKIVTREELRQKLWPSDTFVDFDHSLNSAVKKLREALGDQPENPRFVETLHRRGYRFVASVEGQQRTSEVQADLQGLKQDAEERKTLSTPQSQPVARVEHLRARWNLAVPTAVITAVIVVGVAIGVFIYARSGSGLTKADTVVLADFDNRTGDPVFDDTLNQALIVNLEQSPFLNILPESKKAQMLKMMGRSAEEPLTTTLARDLCVRVSSKAILAGSIANLGSEYVIGVTASNCATGDVLVRQQVRADGKEQVLKSLDEAGAEVRRKLGESLGSVQKYDTPVEQATTPSLEALQAYGTALRTLEFKGEMPSVEYFKHAIELDPNFAMAHAKLGVVYFNLSQVSLAIEHTERAFKLRERVSQRERLYIESHYYDLAAGDLERAAQIYEQWRQIFPQDTIPRSNLGVIYSAFGDWSKALANSNEALKLDPSDATGYTNVAQDLINLNRLGEARAVVMEMQVRGLDNESGPLRFYQLAFLQGDAREMETQVAVASERPGTEDVLVSAQSNTEAYHGRLISAREFTRRAVESALHADAREVAAVWQAHGALREAEFGNQKQARQQAETALKLSTGKDVQTLVALALARAGYGVQAQSIATELNRRLPSDSMLNGYFLPTIRAAIDIRRGNPVNALEQLKTAARHESGTLSLFHLGPLYPIYVRGQALLMLHQGTAAAVEFQKIVDHPGVVLNFPLGALAKLRLAQAYVLQGDTTKALATYHDFFSLWKDADPDIPILKQAKAEYEKVK